MQRFSSVVCWYSILNTGALDKGGVGALELVAMDMKARFWSSEFVWKYLHDMNYITLNNLFLHSGGCMYVVR